MTMKEGVQLIYKFVLFCNVGADIFNVSNIYYSATFY